MSVQCPVCRTPNRASASFCANCGAQLQGVAPRLPTANLSGPAPPGPLPPAPAAALITDAGTRHPLPGALVRIGRDAGNDVVLPDHSVSSRHAEITWDGQTFSLRDLGSRNGTFVNRQPITGPVALAGGERIVFGGLGCSFQARGASAIGYAGTTALDEDQIEAALDAATRRRPSAPAIGAPGDPSQWRGGGPLDSFLAEGWDYFRGWFDRFSGKPLVQGTVISEPQETQDQPPPDISRNMVLAAVLLLFTGLTCIFLLIMLTAGPILVCLGLGALLFAIPMIFMPVQVIFNTLIGWLRDEKPVRIVNFKVQDSSSGIPVDVTLIRRAGRGGSLNLGDQIEVWGRAAGGYAMRASRVRVYETNGQATDYSIRAQQAWPAWIGIAALVAMLLLLIYFATRLWEIRNAGLGDLFDAIF